MQATHFYRASLVALAFGGIVAAPARALITFDQGHDQLFATANFGLSYDTNIATNSTAESDTIFSGGVGLEYTRRAGIISVDANAGVSISRFDKFTGQDFSDPHFQGEFSAQDDRTTADLTLTADRESNADIVSGVRADSWDESAGFKSKYRVTDRYSLSGSLGYASQDFIDQAVLDSSKTYSAGLDLFYTIDSARDFFVGYDFSLQKTSNGVGYYDHSVNFGIDGKILPKLSGTASIGYQLQDPHGSAGASSTGALTEAIALTWSYSQRLKITGSFSQDFSGTSNSGSVNTIASSLDATYAYSSKTDFTAGVGGGYNRFIGAAANGRRDTYFTWNAGVDHSFNDHLKISASYTYFENWSTLAFSDFIRNVISLSASIRF
jgi:hypothetical protein